LDMMHNQRQLNINELLSKNGLTNYSFGPDGRLFNK
jgi:hypothetical protein